MSFPLCVCGRADRSSGGRRALKVPGQRVVFSFDNEWAGKKKKKKRKTYPPSLFSFTRIRNFVVLSPELVISLFFSCVDFRSWLPRTARGFVWIEGFGTGLKASGIVVCEVRICESCRQ